MENKKCLKPPNQKNTYQKKYHTRRNDDEIPVEKASIFTGAFSNESVMLWKVTLSELHLAAPSASFWLFHLGQRGAPIVN